MRLLRNTLLALAALGVLGYTLGLGIYAASSTRPAIDSQPRDIAEAREAIRNLGLEDEYPFEHGFVATPHGRMHYAEQGKGDTVLCLHGNPTWSFLYREFLAGLSDRARVVAPDLIGFGLSEKLHHPKDYSVGGHIEDVSVLVETLDLRDITLVVQDWGGPIGLGLAARYPERIRALVVMNTMGEVPWNGGGPPAALRVLRVPVLGEQLVQGLGIFHRAFVPAGIARKDRRRPEVIRAYTEVQGSWELRAGTLAFPRLLPIKPSDPAVAVIEETEAFLRDFRGPVLIVWGLRDPVFGAHQLDEWRRRFPDAPVLTIDEAGHYLQEDAPEQIVSRIRAFLDDTT